MKCEYNPFQYSFALLALTVFFSFFEVIPELCEVFSNKQFENYYGSG